MRGFRRRESNDEAVPGNPAATQARDGGDGNASLLHALGWHPVIEWFRWIVILGLIVGAYVEGKRQGRQDEVVSTQAQAIEQRDAAIKQRDAEIAAGNERAGQQLVDLAALQTTIQSIERRTGSIGFQLKAALNESALATCVLPADVQRLRADAHQQAADAVTRANAARGGN